MLHQLLVGLPHPACRGEHVLEQVLHLTPWDPTAVVTDLDRDVHISLGDEGFDGQERRLESLAMFHSGSHAVLHHLEEHVVEV